MSNTPPRVGGSSLTRKQVITKNELHKSLQVKLLLMTLRVNVELLDRLQKPAKSFQGCIPSKVVSWDFSPRAEMFRMLPGSCKALRVCLQPLSSGSQANEHTSLPGARGVTVHAVVCYMLPGISRQRCQEVFITMSSRTLYNSLANNAGPFLNHCCRRDASHSC